MIEVGTAACVRHVYTADVMQRQRAVTEYHHIIAYSHL